MRADPLEATLGMRVGLLYPVRVSPPRLGGVCVLRASCVCVFLRSALVPSSCSVSAYAGLILYAWPHT